MEYRKALSTTRRTDRFTEGNRVMEFLEQHYGILDRLEFLPLGASGTSGSGACKGIYRPMRGKDYNSIFVDLQMSGIVCFQNFLKSVIDSDYAADFNPFLDYLTR